MFLWKKGFSIKLIIASIVFITLMTGCSKFTKQTENATGNTPNNNGTDINQSPDISDSASDTNTSSPNSNNASKESPTKDDSSKTILLNIMELAKEGKVVNCQFPAKTTVIDDIEKKWGKPDKSDWVSAAKGTYATYTKHNLAFGFNKGSQIFEIRSFDDKIKKVSLSKVKEVFGKPSYDVKVKGEEIIGYVVNNNFKILLVFPEPTSKKPNPLLSHYSVLYPKGTVNLMADDPGREW
ncbi:DUF4309 domain-containing protein [Clostridium sp. CX1]|uniref:YjgB family protein n=1 Tax=Clostridium sp. CX1 TaxID=2978346 RepID=UPI0021C1E8B9|nr:DUF4309 domain-containing protein [Clostridium sp. CX1]MCT8977930.1 DUF4309 domain-containing protein [Clostridium sp. CX1]